MVRWKTQDQVAQSNSQSHWVLCFCEAGWNSPLIPNLLFSLCFWDGPLGCLLSALCVNPVLFQAILEKEVFSPDLGRPIVCISVNLHSEADAPFSPSSESELGWWGRAAIRKWRFCWNLSNKGANEGKFWGRSSKQRKSHNAWFCSWNYWIRTGE